MAVWYRPEPLCIVVRGIPMPGDIDNTGTIKNSDFGELRLNLVAGLDNMACYLKLNVWEYEPIREILLHVRNMEELRWIIGFLNQRFGWNLELSWEDL